MPSDFGYGVAIDAGSSGSRLYLYRWPKNELASNAFAKVEQEAIFSEERIPGINDEHGAGVSLLGELILLAEAALPSDVEPGEVPIYLGATAGMRITDSAIEADIMTEIRSLLHDSGFLFHDNWARTISGEEEGVYDWLVANYLKNEGDLPTSSRAYGALDLGGASTQISFPVSTAADQFLLRIDGVEYPLYAQSSLYYGVDQARMKYDAEFASSTKSNPCYPSGYTDPRSKVSGSSDWKECLRNVAILFDHTPNCNGGEKVQCPIGGMHRPSINRNQKFIAMSAFFYIWDYLGLNIGTETDDLRELDFKAQHICNLTHEQQMIWHQYQMELYPYKQNTTRPYTQCFNAAFSYHLLSKGYGMPVSKTPIEIYFDINGTKVQWALGLMLVEANNLGSIFRERILKESGHQPDIINTVYTFKFFIVISAALLIILISRKPSIKMLW